MSVIFNLPQLHGYNSPRKYTKNEKKSEKNMCVSVLLTVKSDRERHGHRLKGNSTLKQKNQKPLLCCSLWVQTLQHVVLIVTF